MRFIRYGALMFIVSFWSGTVFGAPVLTVVAQAETSAAWPAGTEFHGFVSQTADPLSPFSGQSIQFRGTETGGSSEALNGAGLIYRYLLSYSEPVTLSSVVVDGAAFNGPDSVLRLLDADQNVLFATPTFGGNTFQTITLNTPGATGTSFFLDEFDTSIGWRYRSGITINAVPAAVPEPSTMALVVLGVAGCFGVKIARNGLRG